MVLKEKEEEKTYMQMHSRPNHPCLLLTHSLLPPYHPPPKVPNICSKIRSRRLSRHARHGTSSVILASGPQITADLGGIAESHADARGAEEGVGGAVVFAEVEIHVGAYRGGEGVALGFFFWKEWRGGSWVGGSVPAKLVSWRVA